MPEELIRLFSIADANMLQFAKTLRLNFIDDQATFEGEDSNFATPFETDWLTAIQAAENDPSDEQRRDQLVQLTNAVEDEMTNCRDTFQNAKRYIEKAFPNNTAVWNEFGYDDYDKQRQSHPLMLQFMKRFHTTAVKYTTQLSAPAVNYDAAKIAEIETRRAALETADNTQEKFKKDMPVFTRQRIEKLNAVWSICTDVAGVGKFLFKDNAAKYNQYLLPPAEENPSVLQLAGLVTDGSNGSPLDDVTVRVETLGGDEVASVNAGSDGAYGFGALGADIYNVIFEKDGYETLAENNVNVPADGTTVELNAQMIALNPVTISGQLTDINTGNGVQGTVTIFEGAEPDGNSLVINTDVNGFYNETINGITTSTNATARGEATGYLQEQQALTLEPGGDYPNVDFSLTPEV